MLLSKLLAEHHSIFRIWPFYCIICIPLSYFLMLMVPYRLRLRPLFMFLFFYLLCISMFIFGIFISLAVGIILFYQAPVKKDKPFWSSVDYPDYQRSPQSHYTDYGEGAGFKILSTTDSHRLVRQKMLVAVNQLNAKNVRKINSLALSDDVDEVRLYAQSLIEKQERKFSKYITKYSIAMQRAEDPITEANCKKQIAEGLWEQVYKYLVINENLEATLQNIYIYATEALEVLPNDIELPLILAKVALLKSDLKEAKKWLKLAARNEAPDYKILSLLAEMEYLEKNYEAIGSTLKPCQGKELVGLEPIISFWVPHD